LPPCPTGDAAGRLLAAWHAGEQPARVAGLLTGAAAGAAAGRREQQVDVVWTGPDSDEHTSRATEQVVANVVAGARRRLLLITFNAQRSRPLHTALDGAARRDVEIDLVLETAVTTHGSPAAPTHFPGSPSGAGAGRR
jgi:phosphatidylserine/phosphatidylglycerophosphate/cardiolipin synthase-like enzyme